MAINAKVANQPKGVRNFGRERRTWPKAKPATDIVFIPSVSGAAALPDRIHDRFRDDLILADSREACRVPAAPA